MSFVMVGELIQQSVRRSGASKKIEAALVLEDCMFVLKKLFGKEIEKKVKPLYLSGMVLKVSVTSSVLACEIKLKETRIISEINKRRKREVVSRISTTL